MELYSRTVVDHFMQPRGLAPVARVDCQGEASSSDPDCPDHVLLALQVEDGRIVAACQQTSGCVATTAGASRLHELLQGLPVEQARGLTAARLKQELDGLPSRHKHCLDVPIVALMRALDALEQR
jgi:NifU-like protein involved in Fe-S cluster formation